MYLQHSFKGNVTLLFLESIGILNRLKLLIHKIIAVYTKLAEIFVIDSSSFLYHKRNKFVIIRYGINLLLWSK